MNTAQHINHICQGYAAAALLRRARAGLLDWHTDCFTEAIPSASACLASSICRAAFGDYQAPWYDRTRDVTDPLGHRAPLADVLRVLDVAIGKLESGRA